MKIDFKLDFTMCSNLKTCESLIKAGLLGDPIFLADNSEKYGNAICVIPDNEDELISRFKKHIQVMC